MQQAARREVTEEVGVTLDREPRRLCTTLWRYAAGETWCVQHFLAALAPAGLPETWEHVAINEGGGGGGPVVCSWLPTEKMDHLYGGQGNAGPLLARPAARRPPGDVVVRPATRADAAFITDLRNRHVATSAAIYTETPTALADVEAWFDLPYPVLVAETADGPAGYASLSAYNAKTGYRFTAENSVYVVDDHHGRGVGGVLLDRLIDAGREMGLRTILARIDTGQTPSLALHLGRGFAPVGVIAEAGFKFGRWRDVAYLQKMLA